VCWGFSSTPMYGVWFDRFKLGCHSHMGDYVRLDKAMSIELLLEIQKLYEKKLFQCKTDEEVLDEFA
jgi:hypothetical protein